MKIQDASIIVFIVIVSLCAIGGALSGYFWHHDNPVEEMAEKIIHSQTNIELDLTPDSPETSISKS